MELGGGHANSLTVEEPGIDTNLSKSKLASPMISHVDSM